MKVLLIMIAIVGAVLFGRAARLEVLQSTPLQPIIGWALFIAASISAVWLARLKFPAWAAIMAAIAVALNMLAPLQMPEAWAPSFNIACAVLCAACVVRNWN